MDMDLDFFVGGDKNRKKLVDNAVSYVGKLNNCNKCLLNIYLPIMVHMFFQKIN